MPYDYDKDYIIQKCKWNPTPGKLYRSYDRSGFYVNDRPSLLNSRGYSRPFSHDGRGENDKLQYGEIFMYVGGVGGRQSVPGHYTAFRILYGEQIKWLIYPERWHSWNESHPIDPIRL